MRRSSPGSRPRPARSCARGTTNASSTKRGARCVRGRRPTCGHIHERGGVLKTLMAVLMLAAAPVAGADSNGAQPGPDPAPTPKPVAATQDPAAAEAKPRLDISGFAMLDMGYQAKQNDP